MILNQFVTDPRGLAPWILDHALVGVQPPGSLFLGSLKRKFLEDS